MAMELDMYAATAILKEMIHSYEHIEINRDMQRTERARIEAQKEALIEYIKGKHDENMYIIQCTAQERIELIKLVGQVFQKENLCEIDVSICKALLDTLSASQQTTFNALSARQQLQLSE